MKKLFGNSIKVVDETYTKKTMIPQYEPSKTAPPLCSLIDYVHYSKLIRNIKQSTVSDEEKKFLTFAASRHIVFNYSKIADYYAHATPEMQKLMEDSALVLIDIDDAIANGYVKLSKDIDAIMSSTGASTKG